MEIFKKLKKGQKVNDSWYGAGTVIRVLKTRAYINLNKIGLQKYDQAHVNMFITILKKV